MTRTRPGDAAQTEQRLVDRARLTIILGAEKAKSTGERHVSVAVPFRTYERNRSVAASVLAGGVAYRLFLWLLPFGLILGGALGLGGRRRWSTRSETSHVRRTPTPGGSSRPACLYEGYTGAKSLQLIHSLIWKEPAPRTKPFSSSLVFTAGICVFIAAVSLTWWFRDQTTLAQVLVLVLMMAPLTGLWLLVSFRLPHGTASWKTLLPAAVFVAVGFQLGHGLIAYFLGPKLEKSTSLYGSLGIVATLLFFMYVVGRIIVTAPILSSALHEELRRQNDRSSPASSTLAAASANVRREDAAEAPPDDR